VHIEAEEEDRPDQVEMKIRVDPRVRDKIYGAAQAREIRTGDYVTMLVAAANGKDFAPFIPPGNTEATRRES